MIEFTPWTYAIGGSLIPKNVSIFSYLIEQAYKGHSSRWAENLKLEVFKIGNFGPKLSFIGEKTYTVSHPPMTHQIQNKTQEEIYKNIKSTYTIVSYSDQLI